MKTTIYLAIREDRSPDGDRFHIFAPAYATLEEAQAAIKREIRSDLIEGHTLANPDEWDEGVLDDGAIRYTVVERDLETVDVPDGVEPSVKYRFKEKRP